MPKTTKTHGIKRHATAKARKRVLFEARRKGFITTGRAAEVGRWDQAWYHLHKMAKAGVLKRTSLGRWEYPKQPGRRGSAALRQLLVEM